jgi:hypothetical protein
MIKRWFTFNESSDNDKEIIKNKFIEIREIFLDFEDNNTITSYSMVSSGGNRVVFNPKKDDVDVFLNQQIKSLFFTNHPLITMVKIYIIVDIKLPGEENEFGSTVIGNEGIKLFDDMLTANSRLIDSGYDVKMDLNSNHHQYKPVKFLIYFNPSS